MGLVPPSWEGAAWYGVAAVVIFTLFYVLAARTWMRHVPIDEPHE